MDKIVVQRGRWFHKYDLSQLGPAGLRMGRGYDCELVLEDRFVDRVQVCLQVSPDDAQSPETQSARASWMLTLNQATNPIFINGRMVQASQVMIKSGDRLTLGRTTLQIFAANHPVVQTDRFVLSRWLTHHAIGPWRAILATLCVMVLAFFSQYLTRYEQNQWQSFVSGTLIPPGILLAWVCVWSFVGRLLRGHPLFFPHLFFAAVGAGLTLALWDIHGYVAFATNNEWVALIADTLAFALVVGVTLGFQLSLASRLRHVFAIGIFVCFGLAVVAGILSVSNQAQWTAQAQHNTALKPPFVPSPAGVSVDAFIANYDAMVADLSKKTREQTQATESEEKSASAQDVDNATGKLGNDQDSGVMVRE